MARARPLFPPDPLDRLLGEAPALQALRAQIRHLARFDAVGHAAVPTVLLQGETGTGKGLVARIIHDSGPRAAGPFIEVNCAAIPETLLEAELFGVEAGAFTDAKQAKPGLFEAASGGTLFLDEIEALPLPLQGKCLTALEAKQVRRVGAVVERLVDVKLIAATQVELNGQVLAGHFRADLYHRLAVVVLALPPLRERGEDILVLARAFLQQYGAAYGVGPQRLSQAAEAWLVGRAWPGNVRELSHLLERVALLETAMLIDPESLARLCLPQPPPEASAASPGPSRPGEPPPETERLAEALRQSGGNLAAAARLLGMSRGGLRHRLHKYQMVRPPPRSSSHTGQETGEGEPARPSSPAAPASDRREEASVVSAPPGGEGQDEQASTRRDDRPVGLTSGSSVESAAGWVPKPVAVLAIAATWPEVSETAAVPYEPWTVARRWEQRLAEKVAGFGGVILQGSTSLLLVAFGLPHTLEQLPQRAIQAALAIRHLAVEASALAGEAAGPVVRLAGHLGTLLVAEETGEPPWRWLAVGETLALPVRLLGHAAPGEVLISAPMARLTAGWVEGQPRTLSSGGDPSDPLLAHRVARLLPRHDARAGMGVRSRSPFLGRGRELGILGARLAQVADGQGQAVGIVGEPGIGKSRLLAEWRQDLAARGITYLEGRCWSYGSAMPYLPILDLLRESCGLMPADRAEAMAEKVYASLQAVGMTPDDWGPYLLHLLGGSAGTERFADVSPEMLKEKTFEVLRQLVLRRSQQQPLVIAVEDLHWMDPTSDAFLASLVERLPAAAILVLGTYRPGYRPPWLDKSYATQLTLLPLSTADSLQVVRAALQTDAVPERQAPVILAKAQGNPFFLEEIAQTLVEQGMLGHDGEMALPSAIHIPLTVQGALGARMDRLPADEKALLQTLAVIGESCSLSLLEEVLAQSGVELHKRLSHLQSAELIYEQPVSPEPWYLFKHVLTQEVAYHTLPQARKQTLHEQTALAIETLAGDRPAERYGELAHHYSCSGNIPKAIEYLIRAGQQAADRSAYREAIVHFTRGLALLQSLADSPERTQQELEVQTALGWALMAVKGQASPEVSIAFTRARELCQQVGETPLLPRVLVGLTTFHQMRGELEMARGLAEERFRLVQHTQDLAGLVSAHNVLGQALSYLGELVPARTHLEQGIALSDSLQHRSRFGGLIPGVSCRRHLARTLWLLGYPEQARLRSHEALSLVQELLQPLNLAAALLSSAVLHQFFREDRAVHEHMETLMALSIGQEFVQRVAQGTIMRGWVRAMQGQWQEGIAQMRHGLTDYQARQNRLVLPYYSTLLTEVYEKCGQTKEGLRGLAEAREAMDRSGERWWEAELYRLQGELLWQHAGGMPLKLTRINSAPVEVDDGRAHGRVALQTEAETCFRQALEVSRQQQAKSLELRAGMSLARLWQQQGKQVEARELLAPIYGWFTEGFDTADLQEAKTLLDSLS